MPGWERCLPCPSLARPRRPQPENSFSSPPTGPVTLAYAVGTGLLRDVAEKVRFKMWRTPDEMRAGLTSGTMQAVVVMPISTAVNLNTRGLGVRLANVMTNGLLYVISTDERIRSVADLKGHRITVPFPNDTPELVFDAVLAHHGLASEVAVDRAGTPFETIQMLLAGRIETAMVSDADGRGCQSARNIDPGDVTLLVP